jgi:hypothetical protein
MMLVRRAIEEIWNQGNYALMDEFVARDLVIDASTQGLEIHGAGGAVR